MIAIHSVRENQPFTFLKRNSAAQATRAYFVAPTANPFGSSAVERSTPERSAPVKSVSRKIATPMSAPENRAPITLAPRKFTLRNRARSNRTFERSQRKNSTPLACAPVRSAPGSRAVRKSLPARFALRKIAPLRFKPDKSACDRSAPLRSARAPPSFPRKNSSCACKISANFLPLCRMLFAFLNPMTSTRFESICLGLYSFILLELVGLRYSPGACQGEPPEQGHSEKLGDDKPGSDIRIKTPRRQAPTASPIGIR